MGSSGGIGRRGSLLGQNPPSPGVQGKEAAHWAQKLVLPAASSAGRAAAGQVSCAAWEERPSELPWAPWGCDHPSPGLAPGPGPSPPSGWSVAAAVPWARASGCCSLTSCPSSDSRTTPCQGTQRQAEGAAGSSPSAGSVAVRAEGAPASQARSTSVAAEVPPGGWGWAATSKAPSPRHRRTPHGVLLGKASSRIGTEHSRTWFQLSAVRLLTGLGTRRGETGLAGALLVHFRCPDHR